METDNTDKPFTLDEMVQYHLDNNRLFLNAVLEGGYGFLNQAEFKEIIDAKRKLMVARDRGDSL